jgi:hypothetical protein
MHTEVHTVEKRDYAVNGRLPMLAAIALASVPSAPAPPMCWST